METDYEKELEALSQVLKKHFGYELRYYCEGKSFFPFFVDIVDPGCPETEKVFSSWGFSYKQCLKNLKAKICFWGLRTRRGDTMKFPHFENASELEMKLSLMGR